MYDVWLLKRDRKNVRLVSTSWLIQRRKSVPLNFSPFGEHYQVGASHDENMYFMIKIISTHDDLILVGTHLHILRDRHSLQTTGHGS